MKFKNELFTADKISDTELRNRIKTIIEHLKEYESYTTPTLDEYPNTKEEADEVDIWSQAVKGAVILLNKFDSEFKYVNEKIDGVVDGYSGYLVDYCLKITKYKVNEEFAEFLKDNYYQMAIRANEKCLTNYGSFILNNNIVDIETFNKPYIILNIGTYPTQDTIYYQVRTKSNKNNLYAVKLFDEVDVLDKRIMEVIN